MTQESNHRSQERKSSCMSWKYLNRFPSQSVQHQSCMSCGTLTPVWRPSPFHLCGVLMRLWGAIDPEGAALRASYWRSNGHHLPPPAHPHHAVKVHLQAHSTWCSGQFSLSKFNNTKHSSIAVSIMEVQVRDIRLGIPTGRLQRSPPNQPSTSPNPQRKC